MVPLRGVLHAHVRILHVPLDVRYILRALRVRDVLLDGTFRVLCALGPRDALLRSLLRDALRQPGRRQPILWAPISYVVLPLLRVGGLSLHLSDSPGALPMWGPLGRGLRVRFLPSAVECY